MPSARTTRFTSAASPSPAITPFPYDIFKRNCSGAAPQVYWNAFRRPVEEALPETYADHAALGIPPPRIFPVAGVYAQGIVSYPTSEEVRAFARDAAARGTTGISFWSYEHMDDEMWDAVARATLDPHDNTEEEEMSSKEFEKLTESLSHLKGRVARLEAAVATIKPPPTPSRRTVTVQPGDTLSAIAARLGLPGWQRLYDANRAVIGPDPNLIRPGQVLVVP